MEVKPPLALPEGFAVSSVEISDDVLTMTVISTQIFPCCPLCHTPATRVHSYYTRTLTDLPCSGQQVRLLVQVRKCWCEVPSCPRRIFAERLTPFIEPQARVTRRLFQVVQILGLATGGRLGVRVTTRLGIQTSRQTILRRIMALPTDPVGNVSELGIDDFSFKRGRTFGTILVDLQTHHPLDLLPDRKASTAAAWMATHPEIDLVSRDRAGDYASAATTGAPQARQCADRFHILKNLGEALEEALSRHLAAHRTQIAQETRVTPLSPALAREPPKRSPKEVGRIQTKRAERLAQYQQAVTLRQQGHSHMEIAQQVGIGHATVSRWLRSGIFPERQPCSRAMAVDPYLPYLRERWEAGCHNIAQLYRELVARGYSHSYHSVQAQVMRLLPDGKKHAAQGCNLAPPPLSAHQAVFLFLRRPADLKVDDQTTLLALRHLHPEIEVAYHLVQEFAQMLRTRTGEWLDQWLEHVRVSGIHELQRFVASVQRDKAAVQAGLTLPQSNGVVEGTVNKLKLIKRMGYGRAGFPLLRQRMLHAL
jgi:transposase